MATYAKGVKSRLLWKPETTYGTAPTGNWNDVMFNSETLDETINTVAAEDIRRSNRFSTALRGGNIAAGGQITCDFLAENKNSSAIYRQAMWLKHLLADSAYSAGSAITPSTIVASTSYARGAVVKNAALDKVYICNLGGTTGASGDLTHVSGRVAHGTTEWEYMGVFKTPPTFVVSTAYILNATVVNIADDKVYRCTVAGTSAASGDLSHSSGEAVSGTATFLYLYAKSSLPDFYTHTMTASTDFPTGGIALEKQILGAAAGHYIVFLGNRFNTLTLTVPQEGIVKAAWDLLGTSTTSSASSSGGTPVSVTDEPYTGYETFACFGAQTAVSTGSKRPIRDLTLTITNNIEGTVYIVGSRYRQDLPEGVIAVTGRATMYFQDATEYNLFKDETETPLYISLIHQGIYLCFNLPEVKLTGAGTPKIGGSGLVTADFDFTGYSDDDVGLSVTMKNDISDLIP